MVNVVKVCPLCGQELYITMTTEEYERYLRYLSGMLIQEALPDYNPMEREFIKTGLCPECQEMFFGTKFKSERIK